MAKRSTIGENPLDAVNQENPLDSVVPDRSAMTRGGRGQSAPEVDPRGTGALARNWKPALRRCGPRRRGSKPCRPKRPP